MDFKKYGMGAEMSPMEALRLAQESRAFAAQGVEMSKDMRQGMAKYGMEGPNDIVEGTEVTRREKRLAKRATRQANRAARREGRFNAPNPNDSSETVSKSAYGIETHH